MTDCKLIDILKENIIQRISRRIDMSYLAATCKSHDYCVIAGNSLNVPTPHDIDVYKFIGDTVNMLELRLMRMEDKNPLDWCVGQGGAHTVLFESPNARTVKHNDTVYQFCAIKNSFHGLINSFDYAHVQVGVKVDLVNKCVSEVYFTDAYVEYVITGKTKFTGSEYPLSSLIRAEKYKKYGILSSSDYKVSVFNALGDVIKRGFEDYKDFKKQIESIDLLLLKKDESNAAYRLFLICQQRGLVKHPTDANTVDELQKIEEKIWNAEENGETETTEQTT